MDKENGYWIECVPLRRPSFLHLESGFYTASVSDFPDIRTYGISPDRAITRLKRRLETLQAQFEVKKDESDDLPRSHSRLRPPASALRGIEGWMSVYVSLKHGNE